MGGLAVYCIYVLSFPLVLIMRSKVARFTIAIGGGSIGGIAAGFLWSAQGAYFAASARLYAEASVDVSFQQATSLFAAIFGTVYLGSEVILKVRDISTGAQHF